MSGQVSSLSFPAATPGADSASVTLQRGITYIGHMDTDGPSVWEMICLAFGIDPADENAFTSVLSRVQTGEQVASAIQKALSPDWQPVKAAVYLGSSSAVEAAILSSGVRVIGNHCDFWLTASFIYKNGASGILSIRDFPFVAVGGARFSLGIAEATGFNTDGRGLVAVLQGSIITFYKGQDTGEPSSAITDADMEDAASVTLSGSFQVEDIL